MHKIKTPTTKTTYICFYVHYNLFPYHPRLLLTSSFYFSPLYIHLYYMLQLPPLDNVVSFTFKYNIDALLFFLLNKVVYLHPFKGVLCN